MKRLDLELYLNSLLAPDSYSDYCPNGLQIEGKHEIKKISFAVSATRDSIKQSIELGSDCLITHHGLFWNSQGARPIVKTFAKRIVPLIQNDINLFSYHLPLDGHSEIGNAAILANKIGLADHCSFGEYKKMPIGIRGVFPVPIKPIHLKEKLISVLNHDVILSCPNENENIGRVGIITGGANSYWSLAEEEGLQAFITGEISENNWHDSKEAGIHMFAGGHHATEVFGVKALMERIENHFSINCVYIDSDNPA